MANPYTNKVIVNDQTIIDLTSDTASASDVAQGKKFHLASGQQATGTNTGTPTQSKTLTLGANTPQTVTPDSGYALSSVPVTLNTSIIKAENIKKNVQMLGITGTHEGGITPSGTKTITANGTYDVTQFASAAVNVQPTLQTKTATANGTVTPDSGYDGLSKVTVVIPTYDGTVI